MDFPAPMGSQWDVASERRTEMSGKGCSPGELDPDEPLPTIPSLAWEGLLLASCITSDLEPAAEPGAG